MTDRELQQLRWKEAEFKPFKMICVIPKPPLRFGIAYDVIGEWSDCWKIADLGEPMDTLCAKHRFITSEEWPAWLDTRAKYHLGEARKYLDLLKGEAPDGRF